MMKKSLKVVIAALMVVVCMAGCGKEQDELLEYINGDTRKEVAELEAKAKDSFLSVSGDNYKDDETMLQEFSTNTADLASQAADMISKANEEASSYEEKLKKLAEDLDVELKGLEK